MKLNAGQKVFIVEDCKVYKGLISGIHAEKTHYYVNVEELTQRLVNRKYIYTDQTQVARVLDDKLTSINNEILKLWS